MMENNDDANGPSTTIESTNLIEDVEYVCARATWYVCISLHWKVNRLDNSLSLSAQCIQNAKFRYVRGRDGENEKQIAAHKLMVISKLYLP